MSWTSTDCGKTVSLVVHEHPVISYAFHPFHPQTILALLDTSDCSHLTCAHSTSLTLSNDFGRTWQSIATNVLDYLW